MKILVTGSWGLVGSECVSYFLGAGHEVVGIDNNMRAKFFGEGASVIKNAISHERYTHLNIDVAEAHQHLDVTFDAIIHCAAQPSHDWSADNPLLDFGTNAVATLLLLEAARKKCPQAVFILASTNKVYGDNPNRLDISEFPTRYEANIVGIDEGMSVDHCIHSVFGVSKLAADMMTQEYGKNFGMKTGVFRCGCITGSRHAGAELHGFLSYMARCRKDEKRYKVYGYKGKQVRDNIHAFDLVRAFDQFIQNPRRGEVYNMGGGPDNSVSVLEALEMFSVPFDYVDKPRVGDHIWYVTDLTKFKKHYPGWDITFTLEKIIENLISA